jgi:hypothetical protein
MVAVIVLSALLCALHWDGLVYFTRSSEPLELGNTVAYKQRFEKEPGFDPELPHNGYVRISGLTGLKSTADGGRWAFFKLAYVPVYVQVGPELAGQIQGDTVFITVAGRLRHMGKTAGYARLQQFYRERFGVSFEHAYILEAGQTPGDFWWVSLIFILMSSFIVINGTLLVRHVRRRLESQGGTR